MISPNLAAAYAALPDDFQVEQFPLHPEFLEEESFHSPGGLFSLADRVRRGDLDALVLLDHLPIPPEICLLLSQVLPRPTLPPLVFHLYGDFTYFASEWARFGTEFKGHPVRFIAASQRQALLVQRCLAGAFEMDQLFFPVDTQRFTYSEQRRQTARAALGFAAEDFLTIYTGRVSLQKNVDLALSAVDALGEMPGRHHFYIAGAFDDVGARFASIDTFDGYMFVKMQRQLAACRFVRPKLLGPLDAGDLLDLLHAADVFVSLSLYHDEDFGMAPAEALATGLPCVLSDWGGYASFPGAGRYAGLVPVTLDRFGLSLDLSTFPALFTHAQRSAREGRAERAASFAAAFSIAAFVPALARTLRQSRQEFPGFSWRVQSLAQQLKRTGGLPASEINPHLLPGAGGLYEELYRAYLPQPTGGPL